MVYDLDLLYDNLITHTYVIFNVTYRPYVYMINNNHLKAYI
jgi:hypothetical protein